MTTKAMTLRIPSEQAAELEFVARADNLPVSDAVRHAIAAHIEQRRTDKQFQDRLKRILEEDQAILDRLAR